MNIYSVQQIVNLFNTSSVYRNVHAIFPKRNFQKSLPKELSIFYIQYLISYSETIFEKISRNFLSSSMRSIFRMFLIEFFVQPLSYIFSCLLRSRFSKSHPALRFPQLLLSCSFFIYLSNVLRQLGRK